MRVRTGALMCRLFTLFTHPLYWLKLFKLFAWLFGA